MPQELKISEGNERIGGYDPDTGRTVEMNVKTDGYYHHIQSVASSSWLIPHNLNKRPTLFIEDTGGNEMHGDVVTINLNNTRVDFSAPVSGTADCN